VTPGLCWYRIGGTATTILSSAVNGKRISVIGYNDQHNQRYCRNKPVHEFLLRHIYLDAMRNSGVSPTKALYLTYLVSIILHEVCDIMYIFIMIGSGMMEAVW
jgi:hypothetical protein